MSRAEGDLEYDYTNHYPWLSGFRQDLLHCKVSVSSSPGEVVMYFIFQKAGRWNTDLKIFLCVSIVSCTSNVNSRQGRVIRIWVRNRAQHLCRCVLLPLSILCGWKMRKSHRISKFHIFLPPLEGRAYLCGSWWIVSEVWYISRIYFFLALISSPADIFVSYFLPPKMDCLRIRWGNRCTVS